MNKHKRGKWQSPLPRSKPPKADGYDIWPAFRLGDELIHTGYHSLAERILCHNVVIFDGYAGVCWNRFEDEIMAVAAEKGIRVRWIQADQFLKSEECITEMTAPWSGGDDPLFGKRCELRLADFHEMTELALVAPDANCDVNILAGPGAALAGWKGLTVYADLPKNEQQYRARERVVTNLGFRHSSGTKEMYKRSYFIDWPVLNRHKAAILGSVDLFVDAQRADDPAWTEGETLRAALTAMSRNMFRVRPWFEPGPWGGTWMKENISGLSEEAPNYAWSFELITPENGLLLESSSLLLEVSFDSLMYTAAEEVLGDCHGRFGTDFPIRFDFLDTFNGGNLSLQCHPRPEYTRVHFGEAFTQEESYYILDAKDDATVFLGFSDDIDPGEFRKQLEESQVNQAPFNADRFVQSHPSAKHDLFLIPFGTVHGSGKNNLVLEISTTPYIFTFKMYDWLRKDLNGQPRDLNIQRAMDNLFFDRKGSYVTEKLISRPELLEEGTGWQLWHLPTHESHLYDVHRYHIQTSVRIPTGNKSLVMNLVEGEKILVETQNGISNVISYAETFVIPAAAGGIRVTNLSGGEAILVKAFIKQA
jgi:mannose-6-phosphate isomerase class I